VLLRFGDLFRGTPLFDEDTIVNVAYVAAGFSGTPGMVFCSSVKSC
jgi:hypothetical protein